MLCFWNSSLPFCGEHPAIPGHQAIGVDQALEDLLSLDEMTAIVGVQCHCLKSPPIW